MNPVPEKFTFITLPKALAQFHHLPEHVPLHTSFVEEAKEKGFPFAEGVKAIEEVLKSDPQVPGSYLYRIFADKWPRWKEAEKFLSAGRLQEAIQELVGILEIDPECPLTCFQLGFCFRATGEFEKSESFYKQALRLAPDAGWIHSNLARTYQAMGDEARAVTSFWEALERLPNDLFVLEQLELIGEIVPLPADPSKPGERSYIKRGDYEKALRGEMEAQSKPVDLLVLGTRALQARLWETAVACFEKTREMSPGGRESEEAEMGLGIATLHAGRTEEAERWLSGYLDKRPESAVGHVNLFKTYLKLDAEDRAWDEIRTAATLAPDDLDVLNQFFLFFENTGREEEGLEALRELGDVNPVVVAPLLLQAQHHDSQKDWAKAEPLLKEALKRSPGSEAVLVYYSAALGKAGRSGEAVELLSSLRRDITFPLAVNLALALRQEGKLGEARKLLEEFKAREDVPPLERLRAEVLRQELNKETT